VRQDSSVEVPVEVAVVCCRCSEVSVERRVEDCGEVCWCGAGVRWRGAGPERCRTAAANLDSELSRHRWHSNAGSNIIVASRFRVPSTNGVGSPPPIPDDLTKTLQRMHEERRTGSPDEDTEGLRLRSVRTPRSGACVTVWHRRTLPT
jgi:hypothetical protein